MQINRSNFLNKKSKEQSLVICLIPLQVPNYSPLNNRLAICHWEWANEGRSLEVIRQRRSPYEDPRRESPREATVAYKHNEITICTLFARGFSCDNLTYNRLIYDVRYISLKSRISEKRLLVLLSETWHNDVEH